MCCSGPRICLKQIHGFWWQRNRCRPRKCCLRWLSVSAIPLWYFPWFVYNLLVCTCVFRQFRYLVDLHCFSWFRSSKLYTGYGMYLFHTDSASEATASRSSIGSSPFTSWSSWRSSSALLQFHYSWYCGNMYWLAREVPLLKQCWRKKKKHGGNNCNFFWPKLRQCSTMQK